MHSAVGFVGIAMFAFAANSLLCRMALANAAIDPGLFTVIRLSSGAFCLLVLVLATQGNWRRPVQVIEKIKHQSSATGALTLFIYAVSFSYAYISMSTGTGALLLFGAVQLTMITSGLVMGERFHVRQWVGFLLALVGLAILLFPGANSPSLYSAILMIISGVAWGIYSLMGKKSTAPLLLTTGNFLLAGMLTLPLIVWLFYANTLHWTNAGVVYALASGIAASGLGYAIWYKALPLIAATTAATVQLSVPVIATLMGWMFLSETIDAQIIMASLMTLGGIWLVILNVRQTK